MSEEHDEQTLVADDFAHHQIQEYHNTPIPLVLKLLYLILPIWGVVTFLLFWDGSRGWLDRGYWRELQAASNTTRNTHLAPYEETTDEESSLDLHERFPNLRV